MAGAPSSSLANMIRRETTMRKSILIVAVFTITFIALNSQAQQPIQPGQATPCWDVTGTTYQTTQCADGRWQIAQPDGSYLNGAGPLPGEYQPIPAENQGSPPMSTYAPGILFNIPTGR